MSNGKTGRTLEMCIMEQKHGQLVSIKRDISLTILHYKFIL